MTHSRDWLIEIRPAYDWLYHFDTLTSTRFDTGPVPLILILPLPPARKHTGDKIMEATIDYNTRLASLLTTIRDTPEQPVAAINEQLLALMGEEKFRKFTDTRAEILLKIANCEVIRSKDFYRQLHAAVEERASRLHRSLNSDPERLRTLTTPRGEMIETLLASFTREHIRTTRDSYIKARLLSGEVTQEQAEAEVVELMANYTAKLFVVAVRVTLRPQFQEEHTRIHKRLYNFFVEMCNRTIQLASDGTFTRMIQERRAQAQQQQQQQTETQEES